MALHCCLMFLSLCVSKHFVHLLDGCCLCYLGMLQVEERVTCFDAVVSKNGSITAKNTAKWNSNVPPCNRLPVTSVQITQTNP